MRIPTFNFCGIARVRNNHIHQHRPFSIVHLQVGTMIPVTDQWFDHNVGRWSDLLEEFT
jgi:hypothetical protein